MNEFDRLLDEAFPASPVSDTLRRRVADLPRPKSAARPVPLRPLWLASAGLAGLALGAALLLPRSASAQALVAKATQGFTGHTRTFAFDAQGKRRFVSEGWYAPGKSRLESGEPAYRRIEVGNTEASFQLYFNADGGSLELLERPTPLPPPDFPATLAPTALAEALRQRGSQSLPPLVDATLDGRKVKKVDLRRVGLGVVLYGAPDSLQLVAYEFFDVLPRRGNVHELTYLEPGSPDPRQFDPVVEIEGRRFDVLKERERIGNELAQPIAEYTVPGGTIAIRGVAMNRHQDLFVLYTGLGAGYGKDYLPGTITDDAGGVYVRGIGFQPYGPPRRGRLPGYSFNGKGLEGAWFARLGGGTPRRVTIAFRKQFEKADQVAFRHVQTVTPLSVDVPDFMPFMTMGMNSPSALEASRAFALAWYFDSKSQWKEMERWTRRALAVDDRRLEAVGIKGNELQHFMLAKALAMQGRKSEARREIAETRARKYKGDGNSIEEELQKLERRLSS